MEIIIYMLAAILIGLNIADIQTTRKILRLGGKEKNPIVNKAIEALGVIKGLIALKIVCVAPFVIISICIPSIYMVAILLGLIGLYGFVVLHNCRQLPG